MFGFMSLFCFIFRSPQTNNFSMWSWNRFNELNICFSIIIVKLTPLIYNNLVICSLFWWLAVKLLDIVYRYKKTNKNNNTHLKIPSFELSWLQLLCCAIISTEGSIPMWLKAGIALSLSPSPSLSWMTHPFFNPNQIL
jgi:hypothetical protein